MPSLQYFVDLYRPVRRVHDWIDLYWPRITDATTCTDLDIHSHTNRCAMKTDMLSTRIDHDTKVAFTDICDQMGLSPSQALKLFARAVVHHGGIPFELKARQPTAVTAAAIQELAERQSLQNQTPKPSN